MDDRGGSVAVVGELVQTREPNVSHHGVRDPDADAPNTYGGIIKPNKWEKFLASDECCTGRKICCSCTSCWTFFVIGWLFVFMLVAKIMSAGMDVFNFEDMPVKSNIKVQEYYAFTTMQSTYTKGCSDKAHEAKEICEQDKNCKWNANKRGRRGSPPDTYCENEDVCPRPPLRPRENILAPFYFIYEGLDGNILSNHNMKLMNKFERTALTTANGAEDKDGRPSPWTDWCK